MIDLPAPGTIRIVCVGNTLDGQPFDGCAPDEVARLSLRCGLPTPPRQAIQEHGTRIDRCGDGLACDAFYLTAGQSALVRHADCMPLVVCDAVAERAVVAHCGWRGIQAGLPAKCVDLLVFEGSRKEDLRVLAGPAIGKRSFEVSEDFQAGFPQSSWSTTAWGTPAVDLASVVASQLAQAGLPPESWMPSEIDTFTDPAWHSHRRTGTPQRNATLCWIPTTADTSRTNRNLLLP
ncbi:MAG TPA: polyphenol oxidase family protein [Fibrobacteria bacterium]|nr:polyphenol oxidase family protein [Fibrobacteria bacterium]HOX53037.1 polyphenol oxidase family protein [Fibrobacteria bacterium]